MTEIVLDNGLDCVIYLGARGHVEMQAFQFFRKDVDDYNHLYLRQLRSDEWNSIGLMLAAKLLQNIRYVDKYEERIKELRRELDDAKRVCPAPTEHQSDSEGSPGADARETV